MKRLRSGRRVKRRSRSTFEILEDRRVLASFFVDTVADTIGGTCAPDNAAANSICSLRDAIAAAEASAGADTIEIPDGTYVIDSINGSFDLFEAQDTTFLGNPANRSAVVIDGDDLSRAFDIFGVGPSYDIRFEGLTIRNGLAQDGSGGGAINASSSVRLFLDQVVIEGNAASSASGGGLQAGGPVDIRNSLFQNNIADQSGGGIHLFDFDDVASLTIVDTQIVNNVAGDPLVDVGVGGGLFVQDGVAGVTLTNVDFDNNDAGDSGGGAYIEGTVNVDGSTFSNNDALGSDSGGGGLYVINGPGTFSIANSTFLSNTAVSGAGGFETVNTGGQIDGTDFVSNQVTGTGINFDQGGGAIAIISGNSLSAPPIVITDSTIAGNTAPVAGGIASVDANLTLNQVTIESNVAVQNGGPAGGLGAISTTNTNPITINNSLIRNNVAAADAGGIGLQDVSLVMSNSTVSGNTAGGAGRAGGIGIRGVTLAPIMQVTSSTIHSNTAATDGGGVGLIDAGLEFTNVTIDGNEATAGNGGGIFYANFSGGERPLVLFSTVSSNTAGGVGGNVAATGDTIDFESSLFADGDGVELGPPGTFNSLGGNLDQSNSMGFAQPTDLVGLNPLLLPLFDNGGLVQTRALDSRSPAVDSATNNFPAFDARGVARPQDGNGDFDGTADIGAFELIGTVEPAILTFSDVEVDEDVGVIDFEVMLIGDAGGPFTVEVATLEVFGGATEGVDYFDSLQTLAFSGNDGDTETFSVTIGVDTEVELDEQFAVDMFDIEGTGNVILDPFLLDFVDAVLLDAFDTPTNAQTLEVDGSNTYVGDGNDVFTFDTSNPNLISQVGLFNSSDLINDLFLDGILLYAANNNNGVTILDVSDPTNLTDDPGQFATAGRATSIDIVGPRAYVTIDNAGLEVFDISAPSSAVSLGTIDTPGNASDVVVIGVTAYVADGSGGIRVLDVSDATSISEIGFFDTAGNAGGLEVVGNTVFVADGTSGIISLDVSDPANIVQLGSFDTTGVAVDVQVRDGIAYVADDGFVALNVSDPSNMFPLTSVDLGGAASQVAVVDGTLHVAHGTLGYVTFEVTPIAQVLGTILNDDVVAPGSITLLLYDDLNGDGTRFGPGPDNVLGTPDDVDDPRLAVFGGALLEISDGLGGFTFVSENNAIGGGTNSVHTFTNLQPGDYRITTSSTDGTRTPDAPLLVTLASGQDLVPIASVPSPVGEVVNDDLAFGFTQQSIQIAFYSDDHGDGTRFAPGPDNVLGTADDVVDPVLPLFNRAVLEISDGLGGFTVVTDTGFSIGGDGTHTFTGLAPGDYRVTAFANDAARFANSTQPVLVTLGRGQEIVSVASSPPPIDELAVEDLNFGFTLQSIQVAFFSDENGDGTRFAPGPDNILGTADDIEDAVLPLFNRAVLEISDGLGGFTVVEDTGLSIGGDGTHTFTGLLPGDYRVTAFANDGARVATTPQPVLVTLVPGQEIVPVASSPQPIDELAVEDLNFGFALQSIQVALFSDDTGDGTRFAPGPDNVLGTVDDVVDPVLPLFNRAVLEMSDGLGGFTVVQDTGFSIGGSGTHTFTGLLPGDYRVTTFANDGGRVATTPQPVLVTLQAGQEIVPVASSPQPIDELAVEDLNFGFTLQSIQVALFSDDNGDGTRFAPGPDNVLGTADDVVDPVLPLFNRAVLEMSDGLGGFTVVEDTGLSIGGNGTHTFTGLLPGDYRVTTFANDAARVANTTQPVFVTLLAGQNIVPVASDPAPINELAVEDLNFGFTLQSIQVALFDDVDGDGTRVGAGPDGILGTADDVVDPFLPDFNRAVLEISDGLGGFAVVEDTGFSIGGASTHLFQGLLPGDYRVTAFANDANRVATTTQPVLVTLGNGQQFVPEASSPQPLGQVVDVDLAFGFTTPVVGTVDLRLTGDGVDAFPQRDDTYTESFTIENLSATDATNVVAVFIVDGTLVSSDSSAGTINEDGSEVTVTIPMLSAGASASVDIQVLVDSNETIGVGLITDGSVFGDEPDPDTTNNDASETATVLGTIFPADDTLNIDEDVPGTIDLVGNDTSNEPLTIDSIDAGSLGTATIDANGTSVTYTPFQHEFGQDVLTYTVVDLLGETATGRLTVNIAPINDPPVAVDDTVNAPDRNPLAIDVAVVLGNDQDVANELQTLTVDAVDAVSSLGGAVTLVGNTITYTPPSVGSPDVVADTFTYTVSDGFDTDVALVTINLPAAEVDLATSVNGNVARAIPSGDVTFFVQVDNFGGFSAGNVESTTVIPNGFVIVSADSPRGTLSVLGNTVTANLGVLDDGESVTVTIATVASSVEGDFTTTTTVISDESDADTLNNSDTELTMVVDSSISGHVHCDRDGNGMEDPGEEVVGTLVFLDANGNRIPDAGEAQMLTDDQGDYLFAGVLDPTLTVVAQVPPDCEAIPGNPAIARQLIDTGRFSRSIDSIDVNDDGFSDLVIASDGSDAVFVVLNDEGDFSTVTRIDVGHRPQGVIAVNTPLSSDPFIAVANIGLSSDGGSIFTFEGVDQEGSPINDQQFAAGNGPIDVAAGDFDGNGVPDIATASFRSSDLQVFMNGSADPIEIGGARLVRAVAIGDANQDGFDDIIGGGFGYPNDEASELVVFPGDGAGGFGDPILADAGKNVVAVRVVDLFVPFDQPGTTDPPSDLRVFSLSANGTLGVYTVDDGEAIRTDALDVGKGANAFDVGDFNRDGLTDLAVSNLGKQSIEIFVGNGNGRFASVTTITEVTAPSDIVVDDFDNDGVADIAVSNFYQDINVGQPGGPEYRLPSTATILRLDLAELPVRIGDTSQEYNFGFQSAAKNHRFDVNEDGEVSMRDALRVINLLAQERSEGESGVATERADVNGDGRTSALDALMIINHLTRQQLADESIDSLIQVADDEDDEQDRFAAIDIVLTSLL